MEENNRFLLHQEDDGKGSEDKMREGEGNRLQGERKTLRGEGVMRKRGKWMSRRWRNRYDRRWMRRTMKKRGMEVKRTKRRNNLSTSAPQQMDLPLLAHDQSPDQSLWLEVWTAPSLLIG